MGVGLGVRVRGEQLGSGSVRAHDGLGVRVSVRCAPTMTLLTRAIIAKTAASEMSVVEIPAWLGVALGLGLGWGRGWG